MPSLKELLIQRGLEDNDEFFKIGMQIVPGYPRRVNILDYCGIPFALEKTLAQSHELKTRSSKTEETESAHQNDHSSVAVTCKPDEETSELSIGTVWSLSENVSVSNNDLPFEGMSGNTESCVLPTTTQLPIQYKKTSEDSLALVDTTKTGQATFPMHTENSHFQTNVTQGMSDDVFISCIDKEHKPENDERKTTDVPQEPAEANTDANLVLNSFLQLLERLSPISDVLSPDSTRNEDENESIEDVAMKKENRDNIPLLIDSDSSDGIDKEMRICASKAIITTSDVSNDKSSISPDRKENDIPEIQIKDAICSNSTRTVTSENGKVISINKDVLSKENPKQDCSLQVLKAAFEENKSPIESVQSEHSGRIIRNKPDCTSINNVASGLKASNAMKQRENDIRKVISKENDPLCTSVSNAKSCNMSTVLDVNRFKSGFDDLTSCTMKNDAIRIHATKLSTLHGISHSKKKPLFKSIGKSGTELQKATDSIANIMKHPFGQDTEKEKKLLGIHAESAKTRVRDKRPKERLLDLNHKPHMPLSKEGAPTSKLLTNRERCVDVDHRNLNKRDTKKRKRKEYEFSSNSKRIIHSDRIVNNFPANETDAMKNSTLLNNSCHIETSAERLCDLKSKKTRLKAELSTLSPNDCHEEKKHRNIKIQKCPISSDQSRMSTLYDVSSKENLSYFKPYTHSPYNVTTIQGKELKHRNVIHPNQGIGHNARQTIKPDDDKNVSHTNESGLKKDMHSSSKVNDGCKNQIVAYQLTGHVGKDKGFKVNRSLSKHERRNELKGIVHETDASPIHQHSKQDKINGQDNDRIDTNSNNRKGDVSKRAVGRHKRHCHARSKSKSKVTKDHVCVKKQCSCSRHQPKVLRSQFTESIDEHGMKNRDNLKQLKNSPDDVSCYKGKNISYNPTYSPSYKCLICDDLFFTSVERLELHQKVSHNKSTMTLQPSNHKLKNKKVINTKPQLKREMVVEDFLSKLGFTETHRNTLSVLIEKSSKKHTQEDSSKHKETSDKGTTENSSNTRQMQQPSVSMVQSPTEYTSIQIEMQAESQKEVVTNKDLTVMNTEKNKTVNVISSPPGSDQYSLVSKKQTFDCPNKTQMERDEEKPEGNISENTQSSSVSVKNQDTNLLDKHYQPELAQKTNEIVSVTNPLPHFELVKKFNNDGIQTTSSIEPQESVGSVISIGSKLTCTKNILSDRLNYRNNDFGQSLIDIRSKQSPSKQAKKTREGSSHVLDLRTKLLKMKSQEGVASMELKGEFGLPLSKHLTSSGEDTDSMRARADSISSVDSLTSNLEILEDPIEIEARETVNQEAYSHKSGETSNISTTQIDTRITIREDEQDTWGRDTDMYARRHYAVNTIKDSNMSNERFYEMASQRQFTDWSNWSHISYGNSPFVKGCFETRQGFHGTEERWPRSGGPISPLRQRSNSSDGPGHIASRKKNYVPYGDWYSRFDKNSIDRRPTLTPDRRQSRSSRRRRSLTPDRRQSFSPDGHRRRTSGRRHSLTPDRKRSPTPDSRRGHSPLRRRNCTPSRRQGHIYENLHYRTLKSRRRRSRTPDRPKRGSPDRKRSRTSNRRRSSTPQARRIRSDSTRTRRSSRPDHRRSRSPDSNGDRPSAFLDHQQNKSRIQKRSEDSDRNQSPSSDPKQSNVPECDDCPQKHTHSHECSQIQGPIDIPASVNKEYCEKSVIRCTKSQKTSPTKKFSFSQHNKSLIFRSMYKRRLSLPQNAYTSQKCSKPSINSVAALKTNCAKQTNTFSNGTANVNISPDESILTIVSNADGSENRTEILNGETKSKITDEHRNSLDDSSNAAIKAHDICETESKTDTLDVVNKTNSQMIDGSVSILHLNTETTPVDSCGNNQNVMDVDDDQTAPAILFVVCQKCGMEFQSCHDLHQHWYSHFGILKCIKCELGFNTQEEHRNHESQSHYEAKDRQNKSLEIESKDAMKLNKCNGKENKTICKNNEVCNENRTEFESKPGVCKDENKNVRRKSLLKLNSIKKKTQRKLSKQIRQTLCHICQMSFKVRIDLVDHLWEQHQKRVFSNMPSRKTSQHQTLFIEAFADNENTRNDTSTDGGTTDKKNVISVEKTCKGIEKDQENALNIIEVVRKGKEKDCLDQKNKLKEKVKDTGIIENNEEYCTDISEPSSDNIKDTSVINICSLNNDGKEVCTNQKYSKLDDDLNENKNASQEKVIPKGRPDVKEVNKKDAAVIDLTTNDPHVKEVARKDPAANKETKKATALNDVTKKDSIDKEATEKHSTGKEVDKRGSTVKEMNKKGPVVKEVTKKDAAVKDVSKNDPAVKEVNKDSTDKKVTKKGPSVKEVTNKDAAFKEVTKKDPQRFCFICSISFDTRINLVDHLWNSHRKRVLVNPRNRDPDSGISPRRGDNRVPRSTNTSPWERNRDTPFPKSRSRSPTRRNQRFERFSGHPSRTQDYPYLSPPRRRQSRALRFERSTSPPYRQIGFPTSTPSRSSPPGYRDSHYQESQSEGQDGSAIGFNPRLTCRKCFFLAETRDDLFAHLKMEHNIGGS